MTTSSSNTNAPSATPLDQGVMSLFDSRLKERGADSAVIAAMTKCFQAEQTPSAEALVVALRKATDSLDLEEVE